MRPGVGSCSSDLSIGASCRYFDRTHEDVVAAAKWCVKWQPFFSQFQLPLVVEVCKHLRIKELKAGQWLMKQNDFCGGESGSLFCVLRGATAVFQQFEGDDMDAKPPSPSLSRTLSRKSTASASFASMYAYTPTGTLGSIEIDRAQSNSSGQLSRVQSMALERALSMKSNLSITIPGFRDGAPSPSSPPFSGLKTPNSLVSALH